MPHRGVPAHVCTTTTRRKRGPFVRHPNKNSKPTRTQPRVRARYICLEQHRLGGAHSNPHAATTTTREPLSTRAWRQEESPNNNTTRLAEPQITVLRNVSSRAETDWRLIT
ncbi:unnamed protein product [Ectocarpus sp. 8 AP-2014]